MTEDQGRKKSQNIGDATVKEDAAIPAKPAALSDDDLNKVAGGATVIIRPNTNIIFTAPLKSPGFTPQ